MSGQDAPRQDGGHGGLGGHGWWRRNALALAALAVVLPATVGAVGWHEWSVHTESTAWRALPIAAGGMGSTTGAIVGPASIEALPSAGFDVPPGARVVAVEVRVTPAEAVSCLPLRLLERGTDRQWDATFAPFDWEGEASCFEATAPVTLRQPFVVPDDAGPFMVDVELLDGGPDLARMLLDGP